MKRPTVKEKIKTNLHENVWRASEVLEAVEEFLLERRQYVDDSGGYIFDYAYRESFGYLAREFAKVIDQMSDPYEGL